MGKVFFLNLACSRVTSRAGAAGYKLMRLSHAPGTPVTSCSHPEDRRRRLHIDHTSRPLARREELALRRAGFVVLAAVSGAKALSLTAAARAVSSLSYLCAFDAAVREEERDFGGRAQRAQKEKDHHYHTIGRDSGGAHMSDLVQ